MVRLIQCNLNRSARAYDLLTQTMMEKDIGIAVISKQFFVPTNSFWFGSNDGLAAIFWRPRLVSSNAVLLMRGRSTVVVEFGQFCVISCYISPNVPRNVS